ncbi:MAG: porin [Desulfobacterales bacterium]
MFRLISLLWFVLIIFISNSYAYEINDKFSVGGVLAGAYQYQWVDGDENLGRGALPFQPEFSFRPTGKDEIFAKFGFAAGNGLNNVLEFNQKPWVADLEDDVKNINGRDRDYLLTAWYKHIFKFSGINALNLTGGIIDARDYVDENAFANNEYTQFMNEALVNGPNGFFPSYDIGGAAEWEIGNFDITALGMNIGENDDGNNFNYLAGQIVYKINTILGKGHYRLIFDTTSKDFLDAEGENKEKQMAGFLSCDQKLGEIFGAWIRFGWVDDKALIDYDILISGGLNITGKWYRRDEDNIGIGYAWLNGENDFDYTQVAEVYWRFVLNDYFAVSADLQYIKDKYDNPDMDDLEGIIGGIRMTAEF